MKKEKNAYPAWEKRLESFLSSPLAIQASQGLSERATIVLHVGDSSFLFRRDGGKNTLSRVESSATGDIHFWVPLSTLRHILDLSEEPDAGIAKLGIAIFEHMFAGEEGKKITFRVCASFLGLWSHGYFSVLKAGGPEVASYLARFGFNSLARIKELLRKVRS